MRYRDKRRQLVQALSPFLLGAIIQPLAGSAVSLLVLGSFTWPAQAATQASWHFEPDKELLTFELAPGQQPTYLLLPRPMRIVIDLPGPLTTAINSPQQYSGAVEEITASEFQPGQTRLVLKLSPDAVLSAEQVELRQLSETNWTLRPLFAEVNQNQTIAAHQANSPSQVLSSPPTPQAKLPEQTARPSSTPTTLANNDPEPSAASAIETLPPISQAPETDIPATTADPIEPPSSSPPDLVDSTPTLSPSAAAFPVPSSDETLPLHQGDLDHLPPDPYSLTDIPPAATTVSVPEAAPIPVAIPVTTPVESAAAELPPLPVQAAPLPSVPPSNHSSLTTVPASTETIPEFAGDRSFSSTTGLAQGSILKLMYSGQEPLALQPGEPFQEVLLVQEPVYNTNNQLLIPAGTPIIGRFETGRRGSRFITQAVSLSQGNIQIAAQSDPIAGKRQPQSSNLLIGSGSGALAGGLIGGPIGLIAGSVVGAASSLFTSPRPAVIEPNQVVIVELTEDWL